MDFSPTAFSTEGVFGEQDTRSGILSKKQVLRSAREEANAEAKRVTAQHPERNKFFRVVQDCLLEEEQLERMLQTEFLPQHSEKQLISPRAFFVSPLFRVCSKRLQREELVKVELTRSSGDVVLRYRGPELRQSDGLVFMALLNEARDYRMGTPIKFSAEALCEKVFGRYDGPTRKLLREHIKRLQQALLEFDRFSVQLCQRFDYPSSGMWSISIDKDVRLLFEQSSQVWLDLQIRKQLPDGLASWLYAFIESQSRLIPMPVATLRSLCGSDATEKSFMKILREALTELANKGLLAKEWSIQKGVLRWMKP